MTTSGDVQAPTRSATPAPQTKRLEVLVGRWNSAGRTVPGPSEPAIQITGTDIYEWLAGGFFLVHRVGGEQVEVLELIGPYDPSDGSYPMRSFDNQGNFATMTARARRRRLDLHGCLGAGHAHHRRGRHHHDRQVGAVRRRLQLAALDGHAVHEDLLAAR